ncbi:MAG TPA: M12 family metallo-peptidase [Povalibacter sp.]
MADAASPGNHKPELGSVTRFKFDAFGRSFHLALEKNSRLATAAAASDDAGPALSLYRGTVDNVAGSWVRLSARGQAIRGLIWDGRELYVVDSPEAVGDFTTTDGSIIFRLADTQIEPGASFCGAHSGSGKTAYSSLLNELKSSPAIMQAQGASLRLELSIIGDSLLRADYADEQRTRDEILTRLNNVDGIYSSQLGVELQATSMGIDDAVAQQLSATTVPTDLVADLAQLRSQTPTLRSRGLTHLFTGRDLEGTTVGIAYTDALCSTRYGAGLTQVSSSTGIDSLVTAHEIGHNFGAVHDGEPEKQCASTPANQYIMSPSVSLGSTMFSECSLESIRPRIQSASCLLPMAPPNLSVPTDLGTTIAAADRPFEWPLLITNVGASTAQNSQVVMLVPPVVTIDEAWVAGGTCTSGAGVISCEMGEIAAAGTRIVHLTLRSDVLGSNSIAARISSLYDASDTNNSGDGTLVIAPEVDVAVALQAPATTETGSSITLVFTAENLAARDASSVAVDISLTDELDAVSAQIANGACSTAGASIRCTLASLGAGQSATGSVGIMAAKAGVASVHASIISGDSIDPVAANDAADQSVTVVQPAAVRHPRLTHTSGGGGSAHFVMLLVLTSLLGVRRVFPRH